jgi:predicted nuclease of predicted toxin-antitoxin system
MRPTVLVDVNLSPEWVAVLGQSGWSAVHWITVGAASAPDADVMNWARSNGQLVFTHDLDFGTTVALTRADGPSVLQVRTKNVLPNVLAPVVIAALNRYESELTKGAIVVVDEHRSRVRILPI